MKFPKLPSRINWRVFLVMTGLLLIVSAGIVTWHWFSSSPFTVETLENLKERIHVDDNNLTINEGDELRINVTYNEKKLPVLSVTLPKDRRWGVPGVELEDKKDVGWCLKLTAPPLRGQEASQQQLDSPWTEHVNNSTSSYSQVNDEKAALIPLASGDFQFVNDETLLADAFHKKMNHAFTNGALANWKTVFSDNSKKSDFLHLLRNNSLSDYADKVFERQSDITQWEDLIRKWAGNGKLFLLESVDAEKSKPEVFRKFQFSARKLRYGWGTWKLCNYRAFMAQSVPVVVTVTPPGEYVLKLHHRGSDNPTEAQKEIYELQKKTAKNITICDGEGKGFLSSWLVTNVSKDHCCIDPFILYPILLSLQAANSETGDTSNVAKIAEIADAFTRNNLSQWDNVAKGLRKNNSNYAQTYIYCYYVLDLVELRRIWRNSKDLTNDFSINTLLDHGQAIAGNLDAQGNFKRHFASSSEYDRSVGLIALYTIIHLMDEFQEYQTKVIAPGLEKKPSNPELKLQEKKIATVANGLERLAKSFRKLSNDGGVRYNNSRKKGDNLFPGYFLATLSLYDREENEVLSEAEFNKAMDLLKTTFGDDSSYPFSLNNEYEDAYRWMFWSRVLERLKKYTMGRGREDTRAEEALDLLRTKFLESVAPSFLNSTDGNTPVWKHQKGQLTTSTRHDVYRDALIMIALETARSELLRQSTNQPEAAGAEAPNE